MSVLVWVGGGGGGGIEVVPEPWRKAELVARTPHPPTRPPTHSHPPVTYSPTHTPRAGAQRESDVDRTMQPSVKARLLSVRDWKGYRNPWMPEDGERGRGAHVTVCIKCMHACMHAHPPALPANHATNTPARPPAHPTLFHAHPTN